jgi:oligosaccharide repeat unit polymerase
MTQSPQAVVAMCSATVAIVCGSLGIVREWSRNDRLTINAVTFLWAGIGYFVGLGALIAAQVTAAADHYSVETGVWAFLATGLGVLGAAIGTRTTVAKAVVRFLPRLPNRVSRGEWAVACVLLLGLALMARWAAFGGAFLTGALVTELPRNWGNYVYDLRHAMLPAGLIAFHLVLHRDTRRLERLVWLGALAIAFVYSLVQFSRRPVVLLVIGMFVYLVHGGYLRRGLLKRRAVFLVLGGALLFLLVVLGAVYRWLVLQTGIGLDWGLFGSLVGNVGPNAVSLDAYTVHLACVDWYSHHKDWLFGNSLVQVITNPIPRSIWFGKPESFGFTIAKLMGDYSTNYGPTIFGEGFANFGLFGSLLFGWVLGLGARTVVLYGENSMSEYTMILTAMISFELFPEVRGDLQGITTPLIERMVLLFAAVGCSVLFARFRRSARTQNARAYLDREDSYKSQETKE